MLNYHVGELTPEIYESVSEDEQPMLKRRFASLLHDAGVHNWRVYIYFDETQKFLYWFYIDWRTVGLMSPSEWRKLEGNLEDEAWWESAISKSA